MKTSHEIDYTICGNHCQAVTIGLDYNETAIADAGSLLYMDEGILMDNIFGDGSESKKQNVISNLLGAGKRLLVGESLFITTFTNNIDTKKAVTFAAPFPGKIIPLDLSKVKNNTIIAQRDSFLCGAKGVSISIALQRKILTGLFGGEGFVLQKLEGDGMVFVSAGGDILEKNLEPGEVIKVDTGCVVCMEPSVNFDIEHVGGIKNMIFGGEGLFLAKLTGPGKVWLQTMPFSHMAGQILNRAGNKGESGSVGGLGMLGNLFEKR